MGKTQAALPEKRDKPVIQSIKRASDILQLFLTEKDALGITDMSRMLGLAKTTIQGIVTTLVMLNYLERDPVTSRYRLGPMLLQLGMKYAINKDFVTIGKAWMERLSFQFNCQVNLGLLVGNRVVVALRVEPENKYMTFPYTGSVIPAHTTCIGKVLYANLDKRNRTKLLRDYKYEALTDNSIKNAKEFESALEKVREQGVSFDNEENFTGMAGVGGPIFNHVGDVIAAFAIVGGVSFIREKRKDIVDAVKYTSQMASSQLGYDRLIFKR